VEKVCSIFLSCIYLSLKLWTVVNEAVIDRTDKTNEPPFQQLFMSVWWAYYEWLRTQQQKPINLAYRPWTIKSHQTWIKSDCRNGRWWCLCSDRFMVIERGVECCFLCAQNCSLHHFISGWHTFSVGKHEILYLLSRLSIDWWTLLANQSPTKDDGCESTDNLGLIDGPFKPLHVALLW
jgi:hypothetical protein